MWGKENSCWVDGNVNRFSNYRKQYGSSVKNLKKTELLYGSAIPILDIQPKEMKTEVQR